MKWLTHSYLIAVLLCVLSSCAAGSRVRTVAATEDGMAAGTFRVIMFGCNYLEDPETIAFLDREDDHIVFEPHAPDFKYRVSAGVPAAEAVGMARRFVACSGSFSRSQVAVVMDEADRTLGYEVRPLYLPLTYGVDDILRVDYRLRADRVVIDIRPIPSVERMLDGGARDRDD